MGTSRKRVMSSVPTVFHSFGVSVQDHSLSAADHLFHVLNPVVDDLQHLGYRRHPVSDIVDLRDNLTPLSVDHAFDAPAASVPDP